MKKITKVHQLMNGHVALDLEDGTTQIVHRGNHEAHAPKAGDIWPPQKEETNETPNEENANKTADAQSEGQPVAGECGEDPHKG